MSSRPRRISRLPGQQLAEHRRHDRPLGLARAVGVERAQDHDRQAVAPVERDRQLVGRNLGGRVRRLGVERVRLADGQGLGRAVDLGRGRVDQASDACATGRLEHVERAADVGVDERGRRDIRVRDRDQRREVEHDLDPLGRALDDPRVPDVAERQLDTVSDIRGRLVQPAGRAARRVQAERADVGALANQALDEVAADEAVGPGDQDRDARKGHATSPPGRGAAARAGRHRASRRRPRTPRRSRRGR